MSLTSLERELLEALEELLPFAHISHARAEGPVPRFEDCYSEYCRQASIAIAKARGEA